MNQQTRTHATTAIRTEITFSLGSVFEGVAVEIWRYEESICVWRRFVVANMFIRVAYTILLRILYL